MSKLSIDQKTVMSLFQDKKSDFLIPNFQRPYAWEETECQTLWDDIFDFAFPGNDYTKFDTDSEYYLGSIVTYKNDETGKKEVIDGQQRLTTLMLLLRAFYVKFGNMQDKQSVATKKNIEQCIWKTNEFGEPDMDALKIDSEVATDNDKEEFLNLLKTGVCNTNDKSHYAENYKFFQKKIDEFLNTYPGYFAYLPNRILNNCILLPIEAENQDTALRIFSTLNNRGKPLSDADIFKAQFYDFYKKQGKITEFIDTWKGLEEICEEIFHPISGTPMDELFTRYMYYERAKKGIKDSTTEALRKFYEKDHYSVLKNDETFQNLQVLADFWQDVAKQNEKRFSAKILRKFLILNFAPNGMWTYFTTVYFLKNRDENGLLEEGDFYNFLNKMIPFIWTYALVNPGVNALRTPVYAEMVNIINGKPVDFESFKFEKTNVENIFNNYRFNNGRPITKSFLAWWAFEKESQPIIKLGTIFEIEHIYAVNRQEKESGLSNEDNLEKLGNKALLEKSINIRASDYRFEDKKKYYVGFTTKNGKVKEPTVINELLQLGKSANDFTETDITNRNKKILDTFTSYLKDVNLLK